MVSPTLLCAAACALSLAFSASAVEVRVPFDPALSGATVRVCRGGWACDIEGSSVQGYWRVDVDSITAPTSLTLKGFVIELPGTVVSVSSSELPGDGAGTFTLTAQGSRLTFGGISGTGYGPATVTAGLYRLNNTPANVEGQFLWTATGTGCIAGPPIRCSGSGPASASGTRTGNLFGSVTGTGNLLTLAGNISVLVPVDAADPGAATITYSINARGTGSRCPGDFNADGDQTINDIFIYLNAWFAGSPNADASGNGAVSIDDIFIFLNAWFAGCP